MTPFPNWLPKTVADYVRKQLVGAALDNDSKARLIRLCSDPGMENAWRALQHAASDQAVLVEFLGFVLRESQFLPNPRTPSPSPAKLRKSFEKIVKLAASLIQELQQAASNGNPDSGIEELRAALIRIAHSPRAQASTGEEFSGEKITATALTLYECLGADPDQPSLTEYLSWLDEAASLAINAPPPPGPRKLAAANVARTQYIRAVDDFILAQIGRYMPSIVATAINVALDLDEQQVTEAHVRNLRVTGTKVKSTTKRRIAAKHRS